MRCGVSVRAGVPCRGAPLASARYPDAQWPDALSWLIDEERRAVFERVGARFETAISHAHLAAAGERQGKPSVLSKAEAPAQGVDYRRMLALSEAETDALLNLLEPWRLRRDGSPTETLTYLHDCVSDTPHGSRSQHALPYRQPTSDTALIGGLT